MLYDNFLFFTCNGNFCITSFTKIFMVKIYAPGFVSIILLSSLVFNFSSFAQNESKDLVSPDKNLIISFQTASAEKAGSKPNQLFYSITFKGRKLFDLSALGLDIAGSDT